MPLSFTVMSIVQTGHTEVFRHRSLYNEIFRYILIQGFHPPERINQCSSGEVQGNFSIKWSPADSHGTSPRSSNWLTITLLRQCLDEHVSNLYNFHFVKPNHWNIKYHGFRNHAAKLLMFLLLGSELCHGE